MDNSLELDAARLDLLKELANIGVGNAATSLSLMLNDEKVVMEVPQVQVTPLQDVPEYLYSPEEPVAAVYFEACGREIDLIFLFVMPLESARELTKRLLPDPLPCFGEMERSVLMELGNIITGAYVNALHAMTGLTFLLSPSNLAIDMSGAVLATAIAETMQVDDDMLLIKTRIHTEKRQIEGSVLILPRDGLLRRLFHLMGVK